MFGPCWKLRANFFFIAFFLFVCLFFSFFVKGPVSRVGRISPRIHIFFCNTSQIIHAWLLSNQLFSPPYMEQEDLSRGRCIFFFPSPFFFSTAAQNGTPATDATLILYHSPAGLKVEMLNTGPFVMVGSLFPDFFLSPPPSSFSFSLESHYCLCQTENRWPLSARWGARCGINTVTATICHATLDQVARHLSTMTKRWCRSVCLK